MIEFTLCKPQNETNRLTSLSHSGFKPRGAVAGGLPFELFSSKCSSVFPVDHIILSSAPFAQSETSCILVTGPSQWGHLDNRRFSCFSASATWPLLYIFAEVGGSQEMLMRHSLKGKLELEELSESVCNKKIKVSIFAVSYTKPVVWLNKCQQILQVSMQVSHISDFLGSHAIARIVATLPVLCRNNRNCSLKAVVEWLRRETREA